MGFGQNLGQWADYIGTALNAPELHISEKLAGGNTMNTDTPQQSVADKNASTANILSQAATQHQLNFGGGGNGGGGTGAGGGTTPSTGNTNTGDGFDMKYYPGWGEKEARADWAATGGSKGNSGGGGQAANSLDANGKDIYDPSLPSLDEQANWIFQDLDKQVAGYGDYKTGMKSELDSAAVDQKLAATAAKNDNVGNLTNDATQEVDRSAGTLRDLSRSANDMLQRLVQMYGGGSAGIQEANYAMGNINRQSGNIMGSRDEALRNIDSKKTAIDTTFNTQGQAIDKWVDDSMKKIGEQIQGWIGDIANAKTSVRAQLSASAVDSARNYLTTLSLNQQQYKQNLDAWKLQRTADLEDYKTKLGLQAQYNPTTYNYDLNSSQTNNSGNSTNKWVTTPTTNTTANTNTGYAGSTTGIDTTAINGLGNSTKKDSFGNIVQV